MNWELNPMFRSFNFFFFFENSFKPPEEILGEKRKVRPDTASTGLLRGAKCRHPAGGVGGERPVWNIPGKSLQMLILCPQTKTLKGRSLSLDSSRNSRAEIKIDR